MPSTLKFSLLILASASLAHPALAKRGSCGAERPQAAPAKAIYMITNDPKQNAVLAIPIALDGTLADGGTMTGTGGAGSISIDGATGEPAATDALVSQSALTLVGNV